MRTLLLFMLLSGSSCWLYAQFTYVIDQTIPVNDLDNNTLSLAWGGGLNSTQYNILDINGDGTTDLVLFDRVANKVITYLAQDNQYVYAPEYERFFPAVNNWLQLRDYNCDGKKDIFTSDPLGIRVYTNITPPGEHLQWEPYLFFAGDNIPKSNVLLTKGFTSKINLQLQFDDIPSITDMDGDGDLDIISMQYPGLSTVEFHKNLSMENHSSCDSLEFERITQRWGDFEECECGNFAFNGTSCPPSSGGRIQHSGGKALLALDIDNDNDMDILFSESECNELFLLENEGDATTPVFSSAVNFPVSDPVNLHTFPVAFYEDVDFDGVRDLMVSPNLYAREFLNTDFQSSNWFYKNNGSTQVPSLALTSTRFLQGQMIDLGDNTVPALFDLDDDGDLDMVIGYNSDSQQFSASLYQFVNIGTNVTPVFRMVTDDYMSIRGQFLYNIKPQFKDVNADGKPDLVFTATRLSGGGTSLYVVLNKATGGGADFVGQPINNVDFTMLFTENVHLTDVNLDGLPDLLVGRSNGSVEYWRNNGPSGSLNFSLAESTYLGLGPSVERQSLSITTADLNSDGRTDLIMGDQYGHISVISNFHQADNEITLYRNIVFNPLTKMYESQNLGGRIWPVAANLFNADKPAIIIGNILGGLQLLRHDEGSSLSPEPLINLYPNPVRQDAALYLMIDRFASVQLLSVLGKELTEPVFVDANQTYPISLPQVASGVYLVRIVINGRSFTKRVIIY